MSAPKCCVSCGRSMVRSDGSIDERVCLKGITHREARGLGFDCWVPRTKFAFYEDAEEYAGAYGNGSEPRIHKERGIYVLEM